MMALLGQAQKIMFLQPEQTYQELMEEKQIHGVEHGHSVNLVILILNYEE